MGAVQVCLRLAVFGNLAALLTWLIVTTRLVPTHKLAALLTWLIFTTRLVPSQTTANITRRDDALNMPSYLCRIIAITSI
jgi:hypothetical protein